MGLDNGIEIKNCPAEIVKKLPNWWIRRFIDDNTVVEPVYMRKWWGVRNDIVGYLQRVYGIDSEAYDWKLTTEDLDAIKQIFKSWNNKHKWESESSSIWYWGESHISRQIKEHCRACDKLVKLLKKYPDLEIIFYDSY